MHPHQRNLNIRKMSEKDKKNSLENVERFVSSIGTVLVRVKDAILKDILKDIVDDGMTWAEYTEKLKNEHPEGALSLFKEFVDRIINKLGYDISQSGSQKLYELISTLVQATTNMQETISQIVAEVEGADSLDLNKIFENGDNLDADSINRISSAVFSDTGSIEKSIEFGNENASVSISMECAKKLMDMVDLVKQIVSVIKQISDFEWSSIAEDAEDFGKFIKESYFTKEFGKRLLDYILLLLLKNAKDVFSDDIHNMVRNIKEEAANKIGELFVGEKEAQMLIELQERIDSIKEEIAEAQECAMSAAEEYGVLPDVTAPVYLQTKLDIAEARFEALSSKTVKGYSKAAKVFKQIYCILDLMGLLQTKRINLMKYIPVAESEDESLNIDPIEVTTLRWDLITTIFTKPLDYLKTVYHITSVRDAEKLIGKIKAVVQAFKEDKTETCTNKSLLYSMAFRIQDQIDEDGNTDSLANAQSIVMNLLNMQEAIVCRLDEVLSEEFRSYRKGGSCVFDIIDYEVTSSFEKITFDENGQYIDQETGIEYIDYSDGEGEEIAEHTKQAAIDNLAPILQRSIQDYILQNAGSESISETEAEEMAEKVATDENVVKELGSILAVSNQKVVDGIVGCWEDHYYNVVSGLSRTFEYDFRDFHNNEEDETEDSEEDPDLNLAGIDFDSITEEETKTQIVDLHKELGEFSNFDADGYFARISDGFADAFQCNLDESQDSLSQAIQNALENVKVEDKIQAADEIMACSWSEIVSTTEQLTAAPYKQTVDLAINKMKSDIFQSLDIQCEDALDAVGAANTEAANDLFCLAQDSGRENPWKDSLAFATKVSELIPEETKNSVKGFVSMPSLKLKMPNHTLDAKNKMLAVELCNLKSGDNFFTLQIVAFVTKRTPDGCSKEKTGIFLMPLLKGKAETTFEIGSSHQIKLGGSIKANDSSVKKADDKTGLFFYTGSKFYDIKVEPYAESESLALDAEVMFGRKKNNTLEIFKTDLAELSIENYPLSMFLSYNKNGDDGFNFGVRGSLENLKLLLKLKELNQFFEMILKDNIAVCLEKLEVGYTIKEGFSIGGSFFVDIPLNAEIEYKGIKFTDLSIELGCRDGDLVARVSTSFSATISGCSIAFTKMGAGCTCNLLDDNGKLGTFDLDPEFKYPTGLAIAIDTSCVKGAGAVEYDKEKGKFTGMASLDIMNKVSVSAMFMLTTDPFSFMGLLSATFEPGIPLGMGFSLTGIGGCLGLNRMIDTDKMREGVRQGTLASVFFVKDVSENITAMISSTEKMFPYKKKQFFVGILAQISYAPVLKCDLGLLIQLPDPVQIVIVGGLHVSAGESDKLIAINVCFLGVIDMDKGISFDAELYDSQIVGLELSGSMAFRLFWGGDTKGFLLSIGGFHPSYKPEEGMKVANMKRLSLGLNYDILKIKLETYMAITSNTFQIGAHLDLKVGWSKFGIVGYAGFDALIQFSPFMFMFNMEMGVAVKCGSWKLMSIDLNLDVQGPAPWKVSGTAKFWFILVSIKVKFSVKWGKDSKDEISEEVKLIELLQKEFDNYHNWIADNSIIGSAVQLAALEEEEIVNEDGSKSKKVMLQPNGKLEFNQSAVPFMTEKAKDKEECYELLKMDFCNKARPVDYDSLEIAGIKAGDCSYKADALKIKQNDFAPSLYKDMSTKEKIKSPSYVKYNSGFAVENASSEMKDKHYLSSDAMHVLKDTAGKGTKAANARNNRTFARKDKESVRRYVDMLEKIRTAQTKE